MTVGWAATARHVHAPAAGRCEYCRMHESLQGGTFHVEHIIPRAHGGPDTADNLALACPRCNLQKSDRVAATDPDSGGSVALFNPRADRWAEHFAWDEYRVVGRTPTGRATVEALGLNHPRRLFIREAEQHFGLFPPDER